MDAKFEWTDDHAAAVNAFRDRLSNYTLLSLRDPKKPYVVRTDASSFAIGAVLEEDDNPLGFLSRRLTDVKTPDPIHDQERLALKRALERWRYLLLTAKTTVYNDHQAVQYLTKLQTDRPLRGPIARWLEETSAVMGAHQPNATRVVGDALSRCPIYQSQPRRISTMGSTNAVTVATGDFGKHKETNSIPPVTPHPDKPVSTVRFVVSACAAPHPIRITHPPPGAKPHMDPDSKVNPEPEPPTVLHPHCQAEMHGIGEEAREVALQRCSELGLAYKRAKENAPIARWWKITSGVNSTTRPLESSCTQLFTVSPASSLST